ncbi:MarR family winged helix-turn-helix transcriptional regulator [Litorisediminicola beolgyonensis]|uniref:MarR family winged helix-turn-helix transcriptional regulator n=1 Tax=Litorisediminicola beolgyonensis TaxID=1173614 RepID=A0ABW3ZK46_9RHOB
MTTESETLSFGVLDGSLGFLLRLAQLQNFETYFDVMGETGLRPGEATVLVVVGANPGVRQGHLCRTLRIKRAHMAKMLKAMESDGLIDRRVPPEDRRAAEVRLTQAGEARVAEFSDALREVERRAFEPLDAREGATLIRLLTKLLQGGRS